MTHDNPFETLIAEQMVAATKRKQEANRKRAEKRLVAQSEADAPMKPGAMEQKLADVSKQMRTYRAYTKAQYDAMKQHPKYANEWNEFVGRVNDTTLDTGDQLVAYLMRQAWIVEAEMGIRYLAMSFIANRLINLRLEGGLAPMDDSLPGEEPTAYEVIRTYLRVMT